MVLNCKICAIRFPGPLDLLLWRVSHSNLCSILLIDVRPASGFPRRTLLLNGAITIVIPYLHSRFRLYALSRAWPDAPSSDARRKAWTWLTGTETVHNSLSLLSFVVFLCDGRCVGALSLMSSSDPVLQIPFVDRSSPGTAFSSFEADLHQGRQL